MCRAQCWGLRGARLKATLDPELKVGTTGSQKDASMEAKSLAAASGNGAGGGVLCPILGRGRGEGLPTESPDEKRQGFGCWENFYEAFRHSLLAVTGCVLRK